MPTKKRIRFLLFKRKSAADRRKNNPAYIRHLIIQRSNELKQDIENPKLDVTIAEMRETVDDYLYEHGILLPEDQLKQLLRELNFHRDNAETFAFELTNALNKLDANT